MNFELLLFSDEKQRLVRGRNPGNGMGRKINAFHIEDQFLYDYDFTRITSLNAATAVGLRIASTRNAFIRREYGGEVSELTDAASPF